MDGVLTDFERAYKDLTGKDISGQWHDSPDFWKPIEEAGVGFWSDMKWTKDGKEIKPSDRIEIIKNPDGTCSMTIKQATIDDKVS